MPKELWILANGQDAENVLKIALENGIGSAIVREAGVKGFNDILIAGELKEFVIDSPESVSNVMRSLGKEERILLRFKDWRIIPLENIISDPKGTKILVAVSSAEEAMTYIDVLEKGADGLVIDSCDKNEMIKIKETLLKNAKEELSVAIVSRIKNIGKGDRVCIDSIKMMSREEGMLIGSHASCLFLVRSESDENGYIEARPFRVNAGSVHSYILVTKGKTKYLSELRSGDPLLVVNSSGYTESTTTGRCKIETRPMIMIETVVNGTEHSVILQNAETVCLLGPDGALPVTSIKNGDRIYVKTDVPGRHCGTPVDENIREI